ncbi:hypothetical protein [Polaribacter dokdonensis]|uniref:Uncharacterized protein n=1 Tax=Polaribacter dokdonensis DSW-5 TaxID=1300348 RepID=A0A0N0UNM0_9FLAO|nr:hypothetical protein [Polaribacter dokdonensis]KOY51967.1 hypothetical protein I602_1527 [Polaribacter dokdonensis DSW-5]SED98735.1 hypothetical protein SAMN05444353_0239 [Polaribacter dokdonensis DSW-5]
MSFKKNLNNPLFWSNFLKVAVPFFFFVTIISLLINSWSAIISGDFMAIAEQNFTNGKWATFWGMKIIISIIYGLYITNKNMK